VKRVLSYGAGVDSFGMLLEALDRGERPDMVAFVDVADPEHEDPGEWPATYQHIEEHVRPLLARERIPFEVIDSKRYPVRDARSLFAWLKARKQIPVAGPNRICTVIAKVERFEAWALDTFKGEPLEVWIGFDAGEAKRAAKDPNAGKPSPWRVNRFPLMTWGLCRCRSEKLIATHGYPIPPKSACVFCPYATRGDFQLLAREEPETFAEIVELEATKPPTKNGAKLSIKNFRTVVRNGVKVYLPTMLPELVAGTYRAPKAELCETCGELKAIKRTGCSYVAAA
jgi:hypothetical protein